MGTSVEFKTKEFKDILKTFAKFSQHTHKKTAITFTFDPPRLVMTSDHAFVSANLTEVVCDGDKDPYCFNPQILLGLTLTGDLVKLSWEGENSPLRLSCGNLKTELRVNLEIPDYPPLPDHIDATEVPLGVLIAITKFLSIPFSFDNRKKELMPVRLWKDEKGNLAAAADDGYSLAKINTEIPIKASHFDVKVPKYIFDCLYSKGTFTDITLLDLGMSTDKSLLTNGHIDIWARGMNDRTSNFDVVIADFKPQTSFTFKPTTLAEAIKPLVDLIPKKEREGTVVKMAVSDNISMTVKHNDTGEGVIEKVEDVEDIYNEGSEKKSSVNMHPQAFHDYTNLFSVEKGTLLANNQMVYYKGAIEAGCHTISINYLFPTVQV